MIKEGHVIILVFGILSCLSYILLSKNKIALAVLFILAAAATLKIYLSANLYLADWDERFHALVAKNLSNHPFKPTLNDNPLLPYDYKNWPSNHIWLHKQPLALWLMGLSIKLFGTTEWAVRIPSLLMSLGTIFFTFKIGQRLFDSKVGWWSAFIFSMVSFPTLLSSGLLPTDHIDTCFIFFIITSIYVGIVAADKNKLWIALLAGVLMGLAILSKWLPALISFGLFTCYLLSKKEIKFSRKTVLCFLFLVSGAIIFLPWQIYIFQAFPKEAIYEYNLNGRHLYEVIEDHGGTIWYHFDILIRNWTYFIILIWIGFIYLIFKSNLGWKGLMFCVWILTPLIIFSLVRTKMVGYPMFCYPAIAIVTAYCFVYFLNKKGIWKWVTPTFILLFSIKLTLQSVNDFKLTTQITRTNQATQQLKEMAKTKGSNPIVLFNTPYYIQAMFYLDGCTAYRSSVDSAIILSIKNKGYDVFIYNRDTEVYESQ